MKSGDRFYDRRFFFCSRHNMMVPVHGLWWFAALTDRPRKIAPIFNGRSTIDFFT